MQLDQQSIDEFKELYRSEYGVKLNDKQAVDYGIRLIGLVKAVCSTNEELKILEKLYTVEIGDN